MQKILGISEAPWNEVIRRGLDADTYVYGQCADALRGVAGKAKVYMGIGVDAPRVRADQAVCTPDIVYRSVMATYRAGGQGVVFSPNYAGMTLANLDGAARALEELGLKPKPAAVAASKRKAAGEVGQAETAVRSPKPGSPKSKSQSSKSQSKPKSKSPRQAAE